MLCTVNFALTLIVFSLLLESRVHLAQLVGFGLRERAGPRRLQRVGVLRGPHQWRARALAARQTHAPGLNWRPADIGGRRKAHLVVPDVAVRLVLGRALLRVAAGGRCLELL